LDLAWTHLTRCRGVVSTCLPRAVVLTHGQPPSGE
jgi:hypothetical protein